MGSDRMMGGVAREVAIAKLSSHTGAEAVGVDLTRPLQPEVRERLYQAFVEHSVLVIRDQRLDAPSHCLVERIVSLVHVHELRVSAVAGSLTAWSAVALGGIASLEWSV